MDEGRGWCDGLLGARVRDDGLDEIMRRYHRIHELPFLPTKGVV